MNGHPLLQESAVPFSLILTEHGGRLECLSPLRTRPGKRLTCVGTRDNKLVVAKIFHATQSGVRHWKQDLAGLQALQEAGIRAPRVKLWDSDPSLDLAFIITEFLNTAETFLDAWKENRNTAHRKSMLCRLLEVVAGQHLAGLLHTDPHLRNFMLDEGQVVTIDGGDIQVLGAELTQQQCIDNLGLLLAQFPTTELEATGNCLEAYLARRGWYAGKQLLNRIREATRLARAHRWDKYSRKLFRSCSAFAAQRDRRRRLVCKRDCFEGEVRDFLQTPEDFLHSARAKCLKDGNSSSVFSLELDGRARIIKRYNIKSPSHALRRAFQPTRAARSWRNSLGLEFHGIPTAPVVAFLEHRFGPIRSRAYLIMEQLHGPTLREYLANRDEPDPVVLNRVVDLIRHLREMHISHGDMKAANFIIGADETAIIDLDSMLFFRTGKTYQQAGAADTRRFLENWRQQPALLKRFSNLLMPSSADSADPHHVD